VARINFALLAGDVLALTAFGLIGLASHEKSLSGETLARSLLPFVVSWVVVGSVAGVFVRRVPEDWARLGFAWLIAGFLALCGRALIFDRELFNAFFVIALAGNGLFLFGWRFAYQIVDSRRGLRST
jgi:hypothetical protein